MLDSGERVRLVTAIRVSGSWTDRDQLLASIAERGDAYHLSGRRFVDSRTCYCATLDLGHLESGCHRTACEPGRATPFAATKSASPSQWQAVGSLRLSGIGGSRRAARKLMRLTLGLLECGGESVEVESSGMLHESASWRELADSKTDFSLLDAYVSTIEQDGVRRSCGMHCLGLRDVVLDRRLPPEEAETLVRALLLYTLEGARALYSGVTVRFGKRQPVFRLVAQPCSSFESEDPRSNPYGIWRLIRVGARSAP